MLIPFPVPPDGVLCSMKLSALLSRQKGKDFYDVMFLPGQTTLDCAFLFMKKGLDNLQELKNAISDLLVNINLGHKSREFEHLLFEKENATRILHNVTFETALFDTVQPVTAHTVRFPACCALIFRLKRIGTGVWYLRPDKMFRRSAVL